MANPPNHLADRAAAAHDLPAAPFGAVPVIGLWVVAALAALVAALWLGPGRAAPPRAPTVTFDLERDLPKAQVSVRRDGKDQPCTWSAGDQRFRCATDYWTFVGPYGGTSAGNARRCTWAHPVAPGATTILRWPDIAMGREVQASLGLVDDAPAGAAVQLQVLTGKTSILTLQSSDARDLDQQTVPVPAGPDKAELRIELRSADHTLRMACLDVRMTDQRRGGGAPVAPDRAEAP